MTSAFRELGDLGKGHATARDSRPQKRGVGAVRDVLMERLARARHIVAESLFLDARVPPVTQ